MNTKVNRPSAARSCDITSQLIVHETVPSAWRRHCARLIELRKHLVEDVDELEKKTRAEGSSFGVSIEEAATDSFDRRLALSLLAMEENAVKEIDAALQRMREGRYGVCEFTGKVIPRQRLEALPWARYTVEAQAEMEQRGDAPGTDVFVGPKGITR